ncbi:hypothetical protein [Lancefieldella rimae]|uniref:hypothetical protein n=1 Tax=Lancefieldella rimae TaxID=1383 RepID=UPI00288A903F|nr:hypothetical protein [Lancefieldella rimae]
MSILGNMGKPLLQNQGCEVDPPTCEVLFATCDVLFCFKKGGFEVLLARKSPFSP